MSLVMHKFVIIFIDGHQIQCRFSSSSKVIIHSKMFLVPSLFQRNIKVSIFRVLYIMISLAEDICG